MNTWCNMRHNVPYVFPETQQSDNFTPAAGIASSHFNFAPAVLGQTTVSYAAFELTHDLNTLNSGGFPSKRIFLYNARGWISGCHTACICSGPT